MKKNEIISLCLVIAAIVAIAISFRLENRNLKPFVFLVALMLLIKAGTPPLRKSSACDEKNRVRQVVSWLFIGILGLSGVAILFSPFIPGVDRHTSVPLSIFFWAVLLFVTWSYFFSARAWFLRRLQWLTGGKDIMIEDKGRWRSRILFTGKDKDGICYYYSPSDHQFFINRIMYLDPLRYEKEYEERKYQLKVRMQQTGVADAWGISDCESSLSFKASVRLYKRNATKKNVCQLRDVMVDLAKDDFNRHLFTRFNLGDETVYLETLHYKCIRMIHVSADGSIERLSLQELQKETAQPSETWNRVVDQLCEDGIMDRIGADDLIDQDTFEHMF